MNKSLPRYRGDAAVSERLLASGVRCVCVCVCWGWGWGGVAVDRVLLPTSVCVLLMSINVTGSSGRAEEDFACSPSSPAKKPEVQQIFRCQRFHEGTWFGHQWTKFDVIDEDQ